MKKILITILSIIMILAMPLSCFAETYVLDPVTGAVLGSDAEDSSVTVGSVRVTSDVNYDINNKEFDFFVGQTKSDYITSNVYDNEYTCDTVIINSNNSNLLNVYLKGEKILEGYNFEISDPGTYLVRLGSDDSMILSFTILDDYVNDVSKVDLPGIYSLSSVKIDGKSTYIPDLRKLDLSTEGEYDVSIVNLCDNSYKYLHFTLDNTAPVLEIYGLTDGEAHNAVSFGDTEQGSTLEIYLEDKQINSAASYSDAGTYYVKYTDRAGNYSEYTFKIHMFLDINAWIYIVVILAVLIAAGVFMIYKRKNLRIS